MGKFNANYRCCSCCCCKVLCPCPVLPSLTALHPPPIALVQGVLASHASSETVAQQVVQNGTMVKLAEFEYNVESTDVMQRFPVELSEVRRAASRRLRTLSINRTASNTDPRCPPFCLSPSWRRS